MDVAPHDALDCLACSTIQAKNGRRAVRELRRVLRRALCNLDAYATVCGQEIEQVLRETTAKKLRGL